MRMQRWIDPDAVGSESNEEHGSAELSLGLYFNSSDVYSATQMLHLSTLMYMFPEADVSMTARKDLVK